MAKSTQKLGRKLDRLNAVLDSLVHSVITMNEDGCILDANAAVENQLGYTREELIGQDVTMLMPEPHASAHKDYVESYITTGQRKIIGIGRHVQARKKDGSLLDISLAVSEAELDGKRIFAGVLRDISLQVERERELQTQRDELLIQAQINQITQSATSPQQLLAEVMQALITLAELEVQSKVGIFLVDTEENKNSNSYEPSQLEGRKGLRLVKTTGSFSDEFLQREAWIPLGACLCGRAAVSGEVIISNNCFNDPRHEHQFAGMTAHGHYIIPLKSAGDVIGVIFLYTDPDPAWDERRISLFETLGNQIGIALDRLWTTNELHASREQLYRLATQDSLTDLKNRRAILEQLSNERDRAQRDGDSVGAILIDIDKFKDVNDNYGHPVGDDVLKQTSHRLTEAVRPYDTVGRLGGEEFLIVLPKADMAIVAVVAERVRKAVEAQPMDCRGEQKLGITISLGATSTNNRMSTNVSNEKLIEEADIALYRAKEGGRNRVETAAIK